MDVRHGWLMSQPVRNIIRRYEDCHRVDTCMLLVSKGWMVIAEDSKFQKDDFSVALLDHSVYIHYPLGIDRGRGRRTL